MKRRIAPLIALTLFLLTAPTLVFAKGVVLNFTDVDIATMVKFVSDLTGKNFIMDDRVKGKISIFSPAKLTNEEAYNVFTSVLELKGFTVVPAGKVLKIVPTSVAKQSGMKVLTDRERGVVNEGYVARVVTLESIAPQDAVSFLQPLISKDAYISAFGPANKILLVDSALNIQKLLGILKQVDTDQTREGAELVFLKNAAAENVAAMVRDWLAGKDKTTPRAGQPAAAQPSGAGIVVPDTRLNAIIIFGSDRDKADVKKFITLIDVVPPTSSSKVNVYYLENAEATEVAKVMDGVLKGTSGAPAAGTPAAAASAAAQQTLFEGGRITITPDKATNSLVIMASPNDYQNLIGVIQKLDKRRRQVFVQAVIAEVSLDKLKEAGVELAALGFGKNSVITGAGTVDPFGVLNKTDASQQSVINLLTALALPAAGGPSNIQVAGVIRALASNGAVNVLSTPTIMTSDNKEAEIFVGENVPFITGTNLSSTGLSQQSVERKDTGITLKITPQISEGEYVKLDIYQEISAVKDPLNKGAAADITTTKRAAKTAVVVRDKDTVVIGGLIQDSDNTTVRKVPLLGDIPVLGWLFKTKSTQRQKTNLMILLTPRIIRGTDEMVEVTKSQQMKFDNVIKNDTPFNLNQQLSQKP
ncbi:type II secretion system secretin GspD [Geomonas sp. RF6]|uniref:type II secretion system secretin GspD n=1 Tax=Geomonas sp. RF6 TaxID=2897342 RepID=UPI001E3B9958|nr:type II secretion system secretin GspD [Geomonas sp. RF6]UFS71594.1 type II secretion system secretin GspD [Geomonas sp. RF6]